MTLYLLDENVIRELRTDGHVNVRAWRQKVNQGDLRISAMTYFETRRGWELRRRKAPALAAAKLAELEAWAAAYGPRMIQIDKAIAEEWARLVGIKDKNRLDRALIATARVHDMVLVTRNVADMRGCDVRMLDPFRKAPKIETV